MHSFLVLAAFTDTKETPVFQFHEEHVGTTTMLFTFHIIILLPITLTRSTLSPLGTIELQYIQTNPTPFNSYFFKEHCHVYDNSQQI